MRTLLPMHYQRAEHPALLNGVEATRRFFTASFSATNMRERLVVAHVDKRARCIGTSQHDGTVDGVDLPFRSIIADAIRLGSAGVILAHNHPSGDSMPSHADLAATRRLSQACETLDVTLLDHLIFGNGNDCSSLRRLGYL